MAEKRQFEFFLLRYVADPVKNEFVNIGVVLLGQSDEPYADIRMTRDWLRVMCMDPDADIEMIESLGRDLRAQLTSVHDRDVLLKKVRESFSGAIQISELKACLGEDPEQELENLTKFYLARRPAAKRDLSGRQRILRVMQDEFERAGVWKLMQQHIAVAEYTHKGDPLKIDCGYKPNGTMKMFHAVPLTTNIDLAKVLAFTYPMMVAGMAKKNVSAELTAVVDSVDRAQDETAFALATLEESGVRIAATAEMPIIAKQAREELRA